MSDTEGVLAHPQGEQLFALDTSRHFVDWLQALGGALAFTTYQGGKLFLIGVGEGGRLSIFERNFERPMGLAVSEDGRTMALATANFIQRFDNILPPGSTTSDGYDTLYAPHAAWVTGDLDVHDVGWGGDGVPIFVNTLFGCIASVSQGHSFRPLWKPPFLSRLAAEDRCHLNGMAVADGTPRYASAVSRSDVADGWRDRRRDGGVVIDVASDAIVAEGLSMPHSPRLHSERLWLLNSGVGEFGFVDVEAGRFEPVGFCPGYARGMALAGNFAVVGLSLARGERAFEGLALDEELARRDAEPRCGLAIFDLASGDMVHWVRIRGLVRELFDVAFLPGVRRPSIIGFKGDDISRVISVDGEGEADR